jgi:tRNA(fMet)-specific endonuclease VapC
MPFLLDANTWIAHFRQTNPEVTQRLRQCSAADISLCSVVLGELLVGVAQSTDKHRAANQAKIDDLRRQYSSLPFDDAAAERYAVIRAELKLQGRMIGGNDLMIAAIALIHGCTLVTNNIAEFGRVPGLTVEDWQSS